MAVLEGDQVVNIIVCHDDEPETDTCIEYTDANPAYIGGDYVDGYFYPPQPFASWTRSEGVWIAPKPMPSDGLWLWDEAAQDWVEPEL